MKNKYKYDRQKALEDFNFINESFGGSKPKVLNWDKFDSLTTAELNELTKIFK